MINDKKNVVENEKKMLYIVVYLLYSTCCCKCLGNKIIQNAINIFCWSEIYLQYVCYTH